jgi:hypothetical protein
MKVDEPLIVYTLMWYRTQLLHQMEIGQIILITL